MPKQFCGFASKGIVMKRVIIFFLLAFLIFPTYGCRSKNEFTVIIENQCDAEIQSVFLEYYVGDTDEIGKIKTAEESTSDFSFTKGKSASFRFDKNHFSEDADLHAFSFALYLVLVDGSEVRAGNLGVAVSYGGTYRYVLRGNTEDGFIFQRGNN